MAYRRSGNGAFVYLTDSITHEMVQVTLDRFNELLLDYNNSEEEMEKNFQLRITKKYVLLGFSKEQIAEFAKKSGKLPKLTSVQEDRVKMIRKDEGIQLNHFAVGKKAGRPAKVTKEAIDSNINENGEEPEKDSTRKKKADKPDSAPARYPWQDDPKYFIGGPCGPLDYSTVDACLYPNRYLDNMCEGCSIYDKCCCKSKISPENFGKKREQVKVRKITWVDNKQQTNQTEQ